MYAVLKEGGKQYKVAAGDVFSVEKREGVVGSDVELKEILMFASGEDVQVGAPNVDGVSVLCRVMAQEKAKKIIVFKHKRRGGFRKKQGHRQFQTTLKVLDIRR